MTKLIKFDWDFIEEYLPDYYGCPLVLESDVIQRFLDGEEIDPSDREIVEKIENPSEYLNALNHKLYMEAWAEYAKIHPLHTND